MPNLQQCPNMFDPVGLLEVFFTYFLRKVPLRTLKEFKKLTTTTRRLIANAGALPARQLLKVGRTDEARHCHGEIGVFGLIW